MTSSKNTTGILDAIHHRTSVRSYTHQRLDHGTILTLLKAATSAPTAIHEEPWEFLIVQDTTVLMKVSDHAKALFREDANHPHNERRRDMLAHFTNPDFNFFYNASTLIAICAKMNGPFVVADCWLAAENLMLAACSLGLGSCVIGSAITALNNPEVKEELGIPAETTVVAPIIVGFPDGETLPTSRKEPRIISWK